MTRLLAKVNRSHRHVQFLGDRLACWRFCTVVSQKACQVRSFTRAWTCLAAQSEEDCSPILVFPRRIDILGRIRLLLKQEMSAVLSPLPCS